MKTKILLVAIIIASLPFFSKAQNAGSLAYNSPYQHQIQSSGLALTYTTQNTITVKGLCNIRPSAYTAIFNISQLGKTAQDADSIAQNIINSIEKEIALLDAEIFVDMIASVPVYDYEMQKRFSKRTYNEIPAGYEIQKNIHITYTDAKLLNRIISICAQQEVYNLIKVDYLCENLDSIKSEMMLKANTMLDAKIDNRSKIFDFNIKSTILEYADAFKIMYPIEQYKAFSAYRSSSVKGTNNTTVNNMDKSKALYYAPIIDKDFDFTINPKLNEPCVQIVYEIKVRYDISKHNTPAPNKKEYYIMTDDGRVQQIFPQ